ncbi:jg1150 [Pararge aegeria aegeria]|uniref:Jg1150 protein n=1 Tax=Pararge aegeria aegeria TaxID=348720 RepID=A0A8S4QKL6_9NEOP|nr:jg1150 [Pararge aegeria aegeria]
MSNRAFCERVQPIEGAMDLLIAAGFSQQKVTNADGVEEDFLVFNKENVPSVESLTVSLEFGIGDVFGLVVPELPSVHTSTL